VKPLLVTPGMVATVDIITGHKSVLDYLLKPVLKGRTEAMRERQFLAEIFGDCAGLFRRRGPQNQRLLQPMITLKGLLPHRRNLPFDQRFERL